MKLAKRAFALFAGLFVFMHGAAVIMADDTGVRFTEGTIDPGRTCSVTIKEYVSNNGDASIMVNGNIIGAEDLLPDGARPVSDAHFCYMKVADFDTGDHIVTGDVNACMFSNLTPRLLDLLYDLNVLPAGESIDYIDGVGIDALVQKANAVSESAVRNLVRTLGKRIPSTDDNGVTQAGGLSPGFYLFAEVSSPDGYVPGSPFCLNLPQTNMSEITVSDHVYAPGQIWLYDLTVFPKNRSVSIDKKIVLHIRNEDGETEEQYVNSSSACIGDTITYEITADVPTIPKSVKNRIYQICDTMDAGLRRAGKISVSIGEDRASAKELTNGADYTVKTVEGTGELLIVLTDKGLVRLNRLTASSHIYVRYDAVLEKDAVIAAPGNTNAATLTYGTNRTDDTNVSSCPVTVYTYMLNLKKTFTPEKDHFGKVKFSVKKEEEKLCFVQESDGIFHVARPDEENAVPLASPNDTTGILHIKGLADGRYILTEEETIPEYSLLGESIEVLIRGRNVALDVENKKSIDLVHTGGAGLFLTIPAAAVMILVGTWIAYSAGKFIKK